jgi:hypothetical protein
MGSFYLKIRDRLLSYMQEGSKTALRGGGRAKEEWDLLTV